MSDDIVARLRNLASCWRPMDPISIDLNQAADEIERLRRNLGCARNQRSTQFCAEAQREVARLTAERDDARRMYCKAVADHYEYACNAELDGAGPYSQKDVAKDEGWDCFKEDGK